MALIDEEPPITLPRGQKIERSPSPFSFSVVKHQSARGLLTA